MSGIFGKEMGRYFHTMTGYVFAAMFVAVASALFVTVNLASQNGDIKVFFSAASTLVAFLMPILTMGAFADERRQKTDEMLMCAPVPVARVVLAKYLAAMCMFLVPLAVTFAYPAVLAKLGAWRPLETFGNYAWLILLASAYCAIGLFISLLTDSAFVAAILTYSLLALTALAGGAADAVKEPFLRALARFVALARRGSAFTYGVFDGGAALYYLSYTLLFLFLCGWTLERRRIA